MKRYEFFDHTADTMFRAYGKTLEEAFANAALATFAIMTDVEKIAPKKEKTIEVSAKKKESLLYDFLEHLIVLVDTEAFLLSKVKKIQITEKNGAYHLEATVAGDNADDYEILTHVKAVTYSDMFIKEEKNLVTIQVVHDL